LTLAYPCHLARFGVLRQGKDKFQTGVVVKVDFSCEPQRVLFHFPKMLSKFDEWIEIDCGRIVGLQTDEIDKVTVEPSKKKQKESIKKEVTLLKSRDKDDECRDLHLGPFTLDEKCFKPGGKSRLKSNPILNVDFLICLVCSARFNVLRKGKGKFQTGVVVDVDFASESKRVLFHFPKMLSKFDEWVAIDSERIAPYKTPNAKLFSTEASEKLVEVHTYETMTTAEMPQGAHIDAAIERPVAEEWNFSGLDEKAFKIGGRLP